MTNWLALEGKTTDASESMTDALQKSDKIATQELISSLSDDEQEKLTILQELLATADLPDYGKRQQATAQKLGITIRSVRRLLRRLRQEGIAKVLRRERSDRGEARISEDWQNFIIKTY